MISFMNFVHNLAFKIIRNKAQIFGDRIGPSFHLRTIGDAVVRYTSNYELDKSSPGS
jgi:hypothetical protein